MTKKPAFLIGAFALLYTAVRFWRLSGSCLWFDEIFSVHAAGHSWNEIVAFVAKDLIHPPLFYLLLKVWISVGGDGLFWLRLFPVIFSVLALVPLWMLCRELKLRPPAIIISFGLFAANGALIKYAQEVRMYSLLLFFSLMSVWLFSRYYFRGKSFWMLVLVNVLLVYTHYFGWFVVVSEVSLILIAQRIKILRTLLMLAIVAAAFVPWIAAIFKFAEPGSSVEQNIGWMQRPGIAKIFELVFDLVDPFYFQQSTAEPAAFYPIAIPLLIIIAVAFILYLRNFGEEENKQRIIFIAVLTGLPISLVFALSWLLPVSIWGSRHLLIVFAPVTIAAAVCLTELKPPMLSRVCLAATSLLVVTALVLQILTAPTHHIWCDWEKAAAEFESRRDKATGEKLYAFEELAAYHLWFSLRKTDGAEVILVKGTGLPEDTAYFLPRGFSGIGVLNESQIQDESVAFAFRATEYNVSSPPLINILSRGYEIIETVPVIPGNPRVYLARSKKSNTRP